MVSPPPVVLGSAPVVLGSPPVVLGSHPVVLGSPPVVLGSAPESPSPPVLVVGSPPVVLGSPPESPSPPGLVVGSFPVVVGSLPVVDGSLPVVDGSAPPSSPSAAPSEPEPPSPASVDAASSPLSPNPVVTAALVNTGVESSPPVSQATIARLAKVRRNLEFESARIAPNAMRVARGQLRGVASSAPRRRLAQRSDGVRPNPAFCSPSPGAWASRHCDHRSAAHLARHLDQITSATRRKAVTFFFGRCLLGALSKLTRVCRPKLGTAAPQVS